MPQHHHHQQPSSSLLVGPGPSYHHHHHHGKDPYDKTSSGKKRSLRRRIVSSFATSRVVGTFAWSLLFGGLCFILLGTSFLNHFPFLPSISNNNSRPPMSMSSSRPQGSPSSPPPPAVSTDGVVILGMHRSGTSMITGLLERMGLSLGPKAELLTAKQGENDKGFFERRQVVVQNDDLMKKQVVNWALGVFKFDHLAALKDALTGDVDFQEGKAALAFFNNAANIPWALKDPRLCITLRFWLPFFTTPPAVLFVYRHPIEVAQSLVRRKEFGLARGLHLWMAYNRLAIENARGLCRVVTSDAALIQDGPGEVQRIHQELKERCGVAVPRKATLEDVNSFIDPKLRHHNQRHPNECQSNNADLWKSDASDVHEKKRQEGAYAHALRIYCAMEDGSIFEPGFEWEDLQDVPPQ